MAVKIEIQKGIQVREIECRTLLNKSGLADYAVNCYSGCAHACIYCYARFATRFTHQGEEWGSFVDVKVNALEILEKEVKKKPLGQVYLSSVCDGWQPLENKYLLTRRCLEILRSYHYPVTILTKSSLASRDLDILAWGNEVTLGVTITTLDERLAKLIEPGASPPLERLDLLQSAKDKGLEVYAFLGPLIPYLTDTLESFVPLLEAIKEIGVDFFYVDKLNQRFGVWQGFKRMLDVSYPHLTDEYRKILFEKRAGFEYQERLMHMISQVVRKENLEKKIRLCF